MHSHQYVRKEELTTDEEMKKLTTIFKQYKNWINEGKWCCSTKEMNRILKISAVSEQKHRGG